MSNINPPRLSRLFSSAALPIPYDGALTIQAAYVAFGVIVVLNGRILGDFEVNTSSGSALVFDSTMYLRTTDSLRLINIAAMTTVMTQDSAPIGTISAYAGNSAPPPGYMWLRKAKLDKTTYAALYTIIGDVFNDGTQSASQFMLPDGDGQFLRAFDSTGLVDVGRVFGSKQADAFASHSHGIAGVSGSASGSVSGAPAPWAGTSIWNTGTTGGTETRPKNIAINYIIKVTDGYRNQQLIDMNAVALNLSTLAAKGSVGVVGQVRNLRASLSAAGTLLTFTWDDLMLTAGPGGAAYRTGSITRTMNIGTVGLGGMDVISTVPVSGYIAFYCLANTVTGDIAIIGQNATSAVMSENFAGAAQAGYNASALISVWGTNASSQLLAHSQLDRTVGTNYIQILNSAVSVGWTNLSIANAVPKNAKIVDILGSIGVTGVSSPSTANILIDVASNVGATGTSNCNYTMVGSWNAQAMLPGTAILTPQQISYTTGSSGGTPSFVAFVTRYTF